MFISIATAKKFKKQYGIKKDEARISKLCKSYNGPDGEFSARFTNTGIVANTDAEVLNDVVNNFSAGLQGSKWEGKVTADAENFIGKRYRMLSAGLVQQVYDFSYNEGEALKQAQAEGLFDDLKFYKDHNFSVDAMVGVTTKAEWSDEGEVPGVNTDVFVNKKFDPKFAEKFEAEFVDSVSVGISFKKEPSHTFEDPWDFWYLLGTEVEGELVRFLVTDIVKLHELSSVADGADPHAKVVSGTVDVSASAEVDEESEQLNAEEEDKEEFSNDTVETCEEPVDTNIEQPTPTETQEDFISKSTLTSTIEAFEAKEQALKTEIEELKLQATRVVDSETFALVQEHGDNLKALVDKGVAQVEFTRQELIKFMRLTGKETLICNVEKATNIDYLFDLYNAFKEDIDNIHFPKNENGSRQGSVDVQTTTEVDEFQIGEITTAPNTQADAAIDKFTSNLETKETK